MRNNLISWRSFRVHITNPVAFIVTIILLGALLMVCEDNPCIHQPDSWACELYMEGREGQ